METVLIIFAAVIIGSWASVMIAFTKFITAYTEKMTAPQQTAEEETTNAEKKRAKELEKAFQDGISDILNYDLTAAYKAGDTVGGRKN